jgi:saccharopine dehydrogenase (NADP+, L-glutamate forming)
MKKILVLGAGMVSRPMIQYLLDQPDYHVIMASRTVSKAEQMIGDHPQGEAFSLDVKQTLWSVFYLTRIM